MKFRFLSKWSIIILSIFINLNFIQVSCGSSRSNKTLQTENLQADLDFEDETDNEREQNNSSLDYEDNTDEMKEYLSSKNNEKKSDNSPLNSHKNSGEMVKRSGDLELAEFELEKVEKNVENEIINLRKRYNNKKFDYKRKIQSNHGIPSSPRLTKIRVETYEIGDEPVGDHSNSYKRRDRSSLSVMTPEDIAKKQHSQMTEQSKVKSTSGRTSDEKEKINKIIIENEIQKKIDAIKNKVKRLIAAEQRHNKIRRNNARYDELQRINSVHTKLSNRNKSFMTPPNTESSLKQQKSINRKSASITREHKLKKLNSRNVVNHHGTRKARTSILKPDFDEQLQLISLKSKHSGDRITRRLRKPPDSKQLSRSSRRLRKPPSAKLTLSKKAQVKKSRHAMNAQNITPDSNFSFNKLSNHRKSARRSRTVRKLSPLMKKHSKTSKHKNERRETDYLTNNDKFGQRKERAVDIPLDQTNFDSVKGFKDSNMVDSQDINSQLVSELSDTFGGFPSDSDDTSLVRYKRVKRA